MPNSKGEVLHGTLDLLVLKTIDSMGPMHVFEIAMRIQQISEDLHAFEPWHAVPGPAAPRVARLDRLQVVYFGK
jgi:hypothetical protein